MEGIRLVLETGFPGLAAVDALEHSSGRGSDVDDTGIGFGDGQVVNASAHLGGSDVSEFEVFQSCFESGLPERREREQEDDYYQ
jgi:hypothetical protein